MKGIGEREAWYREWWSGWILLWVEWNWKSEECLRPNPFCSTFRSCMSKLKSTPFKHWLCFRCSERSTIPIQTHIRGFPNVYATCVPSVWKNVSAIKAFFLFVYYQRNKTIRKCVNEKYNSQHNIYLKK